MTSEGQRGGRDNQLLGRGQGGWENCSDGHPFIGWGGSWVCVRKEAGPGRASWRADGISQEIIGQAGSYRRRDVREGDRFMFGGTQRFEAMTLEADTREQCPQSRGQV